MSWAGQWWDSEVVHGHKGPLLLAFVAFVVTFLTTRSITRLIRAGRGPFHNVKADGVHLHHSTPGVILLVTGGFLAVGADGRSVGNYLAAVLVGVGASLVLDEFAMILHLQDVYWTQEGQLSVNIVTLTAACIGLAASGVSPLGVSDLDDTARAVRGGVLLLLALHLVLVAITALKGKYPTALLGIFLGPLTWAAAVRMARPTSPWARWFYSPDKIDRARRRATDFDRRWAPVRTHWDDLIGGSPSVPAAEGAPPNEHPVAGSSTR